MSLPPQLKPPMEWIRRARYRALAFVLAILLAATATIVLTGLPWLPVVGAALVTVAATVSKLTTRLLQPTCMSCGKDLSGEPIAMHGIACPDCGSVQMPSLIDLARLDSTRARFDLPEEAAPETPPDDLRPA